jgi:hypothetical protein
METVEMLQIQSRFKEIEILIQDLAKNKIVAPEPNESPNIEEIAKALSAAQKIFKLAYKNKTGSFTEYADLSSCLESVREAFGQNGLSISQPIIEDANGIVLHTIIRHSSGQFIKSKIRVIPPTDGDLRKLCSQVTYLRRYALASLIGITGSGEDDDGELAIKERDDTFSKGTALKEQIKNAQGFDDSGVIITINQYQLDELNEELDGWPDICSDIKQQWGLRVLADMPATKYKAAITRIRSIKEERKKH